jgi:hypothetical protein
MRCFWLFWVVLLFCPVSHGQTILYSQPYEVQTLYLLCEASPGVYIQNCDLNATVAAVPNTNGHFHGGLPRYGNPRQGSFYPSSGNTGTQGYLTSQYGATRIGQTESLQVCAVGGSCTNAVMVVRRPNLEEMWEGYAHVMIGAAASHPYNHFFTSDAKERAINIVQKYATEFGQTTNPESWEPVGVNDSSLPHGGVFDICATVDCSATQQNPSGGPNPWSGPHQSSAHDTGEAFDVRGNTAPNNIINSDAVKNRFLDICREEGMPFAIRESVGTANEHIHCAKF